MANDTKKVTGKEWKYNILKKTVQKKFNKEIFGFDIETYNKNKSFYCASIYSDNEKFCKTFYNKESCINYFKKTRFRNSVIAASNLQFDFFGMFHDKPEEKKFRYLFRGSSLLLTETYLYNKNFISPFSLDKKHKYNKLTFLDTGNYIMLPVKALGKMIKVPKLKKPSFIGLKPKNSEEKEELVKYNMRDSEISQKTIKFLFSTFEKLGATPKNTIASSSLSLYRNKFLKESYFVHDRNILLEQFKAYYGGRCEAIKRGEFFNYNYYDFNSLYPSVMMNEYPNPNSLRFNNKNSLKYILNNEGVSEVLIYSPPIDYPFLPYKFDKKLFFPSGTFKSWYSHVELKKAMELGYKILMVFRTYYYTENCYPFKDFVKELWDVRLKYQFENNNMEKVVKLLLNSLYGKFGQKFTDRDNWLPCDIPLKKIHSYKHIERVGNFFRVKKDFEKPSVFCFPIWSLYTTAYARIKLYEFILLTKPIYYDTDSLITKQEILSSKKIGKLKLVSKIKYGIIVKPKFYCYEDSEDKFFSKVKGLPIRFKDISDFKDFVNHPYKKYFKFMKFKESMRRKKIPNEIIEMFKNFDIEDNKRVWKNKFDFYLQDSKPIKLLEAIQKKEIIE